MKGLIKKSIETAKRWQNEANKCMTLEEKIIQKQLGKLLENPKDKVVLTHIIDQSFRSSNYLQVQDQLHYLIEKYQLPSFLGRGQQLGVSFLLYVSQFKPSFFIPRMIEFIRKQSRRIVIPGDKNIFNKHLSKRVKEGLSININHIGEAVLGEKESQKHLNMYLSDLDNKSVSCVSVKISTLYSQISSLAHEKTVNQIVKKLTKLYHKAMSISGDVRFSEHKLVNLDMEEYKDLHITVDAFKQTLEQDEFKSYMGSIALQAYIPDSYAVFNDLLKWSQQRVKNGGAPIRVRLVKGANLEMEQVDAALHGWPCVVHDTKEDVDANYKLMLKLALDPAYKDCVRVGVASHNLFDLAFAYHLASKNKTMDVMSFEVLEGMANHICRAIEKEVPRMLIYASR